MAFLLSTCLTNPPTLSRCRRICARQYLRKSIRILRSSIVRRAGTAYWWPRIGNYKSYELPPPMTSEMVSTIPCGIVRHVHSATTPLGKTLRHTWKCYLMRLWRVGTNTLYILRAIGSLFVRFMAQPPIYSFQGSDMFILSRTVVRVKAIHPTSDFIGRGFLASYL